MLADLLFLMFAATLLIAALGVVSARNPMYCVLFMILAFFNAAGLFILLGAELLGLLLIMVYVGAIAVMFLFVVMTIDVDVATHRRTDTNLVPMAILVAGVLLLELVGSAWGGLYYPLPESPVVPAGENAALLGEVLFTRFVVPFQSAGIILLIAMVGAIVLTHRRRGDVKRQDIGKQIQRQRQESMAMTRPEIGKGITGSHFNGKGVSK